MPLWMLRLLSQRLMDEANDGTDAGGGGGGEGGDDVAAAAAAAAALAAKNKPSEREAELLKETMARKQTIEELRTQLKAFEGIDPAAVKQLLADQEAAKAAAVAAEQAALEKAGEFGKVKQQMVDAHTAEKKTLTDQIAALSDQLGQRVGQIDDLTVGLAFNGSETVKKTTYKDTPAKARVIFGAHFERDQTGQIVGFDKPRGAAGRAPIVGGDGNPMPFDAALEKVINMDPDKNAIWLATMKPGAGSNTTSSKSNGEREDSKVTGVARIAAGIAAGQLKPGKELKLS